MPRSNCARNLCSQNGVFLVYSESHPVIFPLFLADCVPASPLARAECADLEAEFLGMWFFKECHNQPQDGATDYDLQFLAKLRIYVSACADENHIRRN